MSSTTDALVNMDALLDKYGFTQTSHLVVPIAGCLFIDFINSFHITIFINRFG